MNPITTWLLAIRPKTLSISVSPVLVGSALAWHDVASFNPVTFVLILISALAIQIATNLYNDAKDFEKGADTESRLGPKRAAQQAWLSVEQIKRGAFISFLLAFAVGIALVWVGGWPIVIIGLLSIACGYAYTGGPKPIAYSPFGELFVLIFFGLLGVAGSYYLQAQALNVMVILASSSLGVLAAAILLVNNYRDLEGDEKVNKLTLVHYIGRLNTRKLFLIFIIYPYVLSLLLVPVYGLNILLVFISLPFAWYLIRYFLRLAITSELNQVLAKTAQLQLLFSVLLAIGLVL